MNNMNSTSTEGMKAQMLRADVIKVLANEQFENIDTIFYETGEALVKDETMAIDLSELDARIVEASNQQEIDSLTLKLMDLVDSKTLEAKNYINGSKVTDSLLEEYQLKVQLAKAFKEGGSNADKLQLEADLMNKTVDELADLIINLNDSYSDSYNRYKMMIGAFRVKVKSLIADGQLDKVNEVLKLAKAFDITTTDVDVKALFE